MLLSVAVAQLAQRLLPDTRRPQFESSHRRIFIHLFTVNCIEKTKRKKRPGIVHLKMSGYLGRNDTKITLQSLLSIYLKCYGFTLSAIYRIKSVFACLAFIFHQNKPKYRKGQCCTILVHFLYFHLFKNAYILNASVFNIADDCTRTKNLRCRK